MSYHWRDLTGTLVGAKFKLTELLHESDAEAVFATREAEQPAIVRIARGERLPENWSEAAKVDHPHIVRTFAAGVERTATEPFAYTVTERPDDSLAEALQGRALSQEEAQEAITGVLKALTDLHARGLAHGAVEPANIVAVGDTVKLSPWSIHRAAPEAASGDVFALGQTIIEVLTQKRPATLSEASAAAVPGILGRVARACMQRRSSAKQALDALEGREDIAVAVPPPVARPSAVSNPVPPFQASEAPPSSSGIPSSGISKGAIAAIIIGILVAIGAMQWFRSGTTVEAPATQVAERMEVKPPPTPESDGQRADAAPSAPPSTPPPAAQPLDQPIPPRRPKPIADAGAESAPESAARPEKSTGDWALVAATYNSHGLAARRGRQIESRWKSWAVDVHPAEGTGKQYMVVLSYAKNRREAQELLSKARAEGLPRDTYVTKITR